MSHVEKNLPPFMITDLCERYHCTIKTLHIELDSRSSGEIFDDWLKYIGIIGYSSKIVLALDGVRALKVKDP
jgi:hypothetical protein